MFRIHAFFLFWLACLLAFTFMAICEAADLMVRVGHYFYVFVPPWAVMAGLLVSWLAASAVGSRMKERDAKANTYVTDTEAHDYFTQQAKPYCHATKGNATLFCTLVRGHVGAHIAHNTAGDVIDHWPNEST